MKIPFNVITFHFINLLIVGIGQNKVTYFSGQIQRVKDYNYWSFWYKFLAKSIIHNKL